MLPGAGGGVRESACNGHRAKVWEGGKVLEMEGGDGCTQSEDT